jgi:hypothetical protein
MSGDADSSELVEQTGARGPKKRKGAKQSFVHDAPEL